MINVYNQVPSIYPKISRDFQYLSWLINIVLNSVKHNVDDLYELPNNKADPKLAELLALTLGFKVRRNYDQKQLAALVSIIPTILKYKGTEKAITMTGEALITAAGAVGAFSCEPEGSTLKIVLPKDLVDTTLFMDILPYILPAGMTCKVVRKTQYPFSAKTRLKYRDIPKAALHADLSWNDDLQTSMGASGLFDVGKTFAGFTNYEQPTNEIPDEVDHVLNAGLVNNTIIPTLSTTPLDDPKSDDILGQS